MKTIQIKRFVQPGTQIVCLACQLPRIVFSLSNHDTGQCPRCGYRGWDYSDELDGFTQRAIVDGRFGGAVVERRRDPERDTEAA